MKEFAPDAVPCTMLARVDLFDSCNTRDDFTAKYKEMVDSAKSTKKIAAALRRCVRDIESMIKVTCPQNLSSFQFEV